MIKYLLRICGYVSLSEIDLMFQDLAHEFALCRQRELEIDNKYRHDSICLFYSDVFRLIDCFQNSLRYGIKIVRAGNGTK